MWLLPPLVLPPQDRLLPTAKASPSSHRSIAANDQGLASIAWEVELGAASSVSPAVRNVHGAVPAAVAAPGAAYMLIYAILLQIQLEEHDWLAMQYNALNQLLPIPSTTRFCTTARLLTNLFSYAAHCSPEHAMQLHPEWV